MNENLLKALDAAAEYWASEENISPPETKKPWMSRPLAWNIIGPVVAAMKADPKLSNIGSLKQLSLGSSEGKQLHDTLLASALVKRTKSLSSATAAVQELLDLVRENSSHARIVMVLAGAEVKEPVELMPGVTLAPFKDLEPPSWMEDFAESRLWPLSRSFQRVAPSAALIKQVPFKPAFISEDHGESQFPLQDVTLLRTVAHCIAVASGRPTAIFKVWIEDDDPRLPLITSGISYSDPRWGSGTAAVHAVDVDCIRAAVLAYQGFQGREECLDIDIALERLAGAWSGWYREERAIDLGIALEAILMHTSGGRQDDNNEISYKIGIRAAWLLGATPEERVAIFRQVRYLYRLRSQAAHSGQVKVKPHTWQSSDGDIEEGITLAGRLVLAVMTHGAWPQWEELVLGGS